MHPTPTHLVYGYPPAALAPAPAGAVQCAPFVVGSVALESVAEASVDAAVALAPPGTLERRYVMAQVLRALKPGARLTLLAPVDKGGKRLKPELVQWGLHVAQRAQAHHRIVEVVRPDVLPDVGAALSEGGLQFLASIDAWTQPGIFSWNREDAGSALLKQHLPPLMGAGADFGCGLGVLSRAVLRSETVTQLTAFDVDRRAVEATRRNVADARMRLHWHDVRDATAPCANLDFIVCNPPFHEVGQEDRSLGQCFITRAAEALRAGGVLWLVANRHLPYEALLAAQFQRVTPVTQDAGYKIYRAEK
jgi:16S rRNA (guanine1207-N2)-methyltransferase